MLYNPAAIQALVERIGWDEPVPPTDIALTTDNVLSASGRFFTSFNLLVTVENVFKCIPNLDVTNDDLTVYLEKLKKDCVLEVLNKIFDSNPLANYQYSGQVRSINYLTDYSDVIISKAAIFDECIGNSMVVRCFQLFVATIRSNENERTIAASFELLMAQLEGLKNEYGKTIQKGYKSIFEDEIRKAIAVLFPTEDKKRPTLVGRSVW